MTVTQEAAQDFRALITHMTDQQIMTFLDNTINQAGAERLEVNKLARNVGGVIIEEFTMRLIFADEAPEADA